MAASTTRYGGSGFTTIRSTRLRLAYLAACYDGPLNELGKPKEGGPAWLIAAKLKAKSSKSTH